MKYIFSIICLLSVGCASAPKPVVIQTQRPSIHDIMFSRFNLHSDRLNACLIKFYEAKDLGDMKLVYKMSDSMLYYMGAETEDRDLMNITDKLNQ